MSAHEDKTNETTSLTDDNLPYTSSSDMLQIKLNDPLVEIVGYIDQVEGGKYVKDNKYVLSFTLNNDDEQSVKVVAWSKQAKRIERLIELLSIVHINGAMACKTNERYNSGTLSLQLVITSNTELEILGKHNIKPKEILTYNLSEITEFPKNLLYITGYIKTKFGIVQNQQDPTNAICLGSIAHNRRKLIIKISQFQNDFENPFKIGENVKILGKFCTANNPVCFVTTKLSDIKKESDKTMSRKELLLATNDISFSSKELIQAIPSTSSTESSHARKKFKPTIVEDDSDNSDSE